MSRKDRQKQPFTAALPGRGKDPRYDLLPEEQCVPIFRADQMDMDGPWSWTSFAVAGLPKLLGQIFEAQKLTWQEHGKHGSHSVSVEKLVPTARKRLSDLKRDDLADLYSLRLLGGRPRIWGIKDRNFLHLLWWDPNHAVCPSLKKHT